MRDGFHAIINGWALHDGIVDLTERIEAAAEWTKANGPLQPNEEATIKLMIEAQIARGEDEYGPPHEQAGYEDEGDCPSCGSRLRYREVIPEADVGCNYCSECSSSGNRTRSRSGRTARRSPGQGRTSRVVGGRR